MHVRVRIFGKPDAIVVVESKLTKIDQFRRIVKDKFDVPVKLQRLFYGGKLLEDGYTFHDYNIKLNDVIQLMVRAQEESPEKKLAHETKDSNKTEKVYEDIDSRLYAVGDLVDIRDREQGAWFEGKIVRIVCDPDVPRVKKRQSDENVPPPEVKTTESPSRKKKGIEEFFSRSVSRARKKINEDKTSSDGDAILYKVQLDADEDDSNLYCKLKEIRPRARTIIKVKDLKIGQKVMVNHNTENCHEKGYWYDLKVDKIIENGKSCDLIGTLYLGPEAVPQNDTTVPIHDKIYAIEDVVPLNDRSDDYKKVISTPTEKRSQPLNCLKCRDVEETPCTECGCYLCAGKENPENIVLCDECDNGYHMKCLKPPMKALPEEDWYCPSCKRDPNDVVAPGAAKQTKKTTASKTTRDWGRGMACVGKTKTCAMPANHFGPIPGIEVGMCWRFRIQLSESGVHRPPVSGIHGRDVEGAYSIVLSGGYEDDVDYGDEFTYTGSGGRDLSGNKRTAEQSCDQTLTRENKALARNCAVKTISEEGGDAGDAWRSGKPVRVVRSYKMIKHFPKYAPKEGIRYDGIYKVVKYYPEKGLSGFIVWKYLLRRDDPNPAPWDPSAKQFPIVYPDGYLEAEAEKKAQKERQGKGKGSKKRALRESNHSPSKEESSPPTKKMRSSADGKKGKGTKNAKAAISPKSPKIKISSMFNNSKAKTPKEDIEAILTAEERAAVKEDHLNVKLWDECLDICEKNGKKEFVEHVTQVFLCIICQEVIAGPVTTPCQHNFCLSCLKLAFKSTGTRTCPCCRQSLPKDDMEPNEKLKAALQAIMPGYDAGRNKD